MTDSCTLQDWKDCRREEQRPKKTSPIATEWLVTKQSKRHDMSVVGSASGNGWPGGVVNRRLCITGTGQVLEKDDSGAIVSIRQLSELYAIVRPPEAGDTIWLEYADGHSRKYSSKSRDSLLVSLLDAATTLGKNPKVQVSDVPSGGYCLASFSTMSTPEKSGGIFQPISIPLHCLKRVHTLGVGAFSYMNSNTESSTEEGVPMNPIHECRNVMEICREFNASVLPTAEGLPRTENDKQVMGSIGSLWGLVARLLKCKNDRNLAEQAAGPILQTLHRLSKTPAGYKNSIELATFLDCIPLLLTIDDAFSKFWAFRTITVLLSGLPGKLRSKEIEYVNKSVIFGAGGPRIVHDMVQSILDQGGSDLLRMVMSDILQSVLCSYADTTSPEVFASFIKALGENYPALLNTLYQQTPFVLENSALLLHLLNTHAPTVADAIREASLASGILLHHFHAAIFSPMAGQRFLSRFLCSLWLSGPMQCDEKKLLKRMVPRGFIPYLKMPLLSRAEEEQLDVIEQDIMEENIPEQGKRSIGSDQMTGAAGTNTARLRSRIALARATSSHGALESQTQENFRIFFHTLTQDQNLPDLIWNQQTRRELRIGLESEIQYIHRETEARGMDKIAWNHQQFTIEYPSLDGELRVGSVYMRLWLEAGDGFIKSWDEPLRLFELLFRRLLCELDRNTKVTVMCVRCLERLYAVHGEEIGAFPDVMILIRSMTSTRSIETQHRLLGLLATILGVRQDGEEGKDSVNVPENAEQLLNVDSIEQLCQFVAWGHTNGVQVGNLMTTLLEETQPKSALLTDGSQIKPGDYSNTTAETSSISLYDKCPPVWFVATTHRVPPPPETVRGPFRVSELQKKIQSGEISPFTLVTSMHVENYDEEDGSDGAESIQIDTGKWKRLDEIWQLRWQLCTDGNDTGIYSPSEVAKRAILSLTRLVDLHRSLDSRGLPYYPIPIAKRIICGLRKDPFSSANGETVDQRVSFLSVLAQSILCNDPDVVDQAAHLLFKLTQYNEEATSKLYLTGVFFFMACYTGSNFLALSKLIHATHLEQHFRSGYAAAAQNDELSVKDRSVLGGLLPQGVLNILVNYGIERFNDVFVGQSDNPEVIWDLEMRKHLIEMVRQHLGDFPRRLWQNTTTQYEYCPMPSVAYKRLEKEIFCHNFYLRNLCDEVRFPDWPISEPIEVFRSCLEQFKKQMHRDETDEEEAIQEAAKILDLNSGDSSKELRKSYRMLARKYHPDKNPAGREMFEAVQKAYELLLPVIESGQELKILNDNGVESGNDGSLMSNSAEGFAGGKSQMETLQLLIKTQILICKRFETDVGKYKYPAYRLLLSCLQLPDSCIDARKNDDGGGQIFSTPLLMERRALFVRDALTLIFRTCLVSPLNAEELVSEAGIPILYSVFDFYLHVASMLHKRTGDITVSAGNDIVHEILSTVVHTIAGVAYYERGRVAIESLPNLSEFCINWRRCIDGKFLSESKKANDLSLKRFAVEGVANMGRSSVLQEVLVGSGVIWPLGRFLLGYDPTLDESSVPRDNLEDDIGASQASSNTLARLSARALGMLSGSLQDPKLVTPKNLELQVALNTMLTRPISLLLRNKRTSEILRILNTNIESPAKIWNVEMRGELMTLLSSMEAIRPEAKVQTVAEELNGLSEFKYSALQNELRIGGIYVRIFNKVGVEKGNLRDVEDPVFFAQELINYIARCINGCNSLPEDWVELNLPGMKPEEEIVSENLLETVSITDRRFVMVVSALRLLIRADTPIDDTLYAPSVLLSLLELPQGSEAFEIGCDVLSILTSRQGFVNAVAAQGDLWRLLWILERPGLSDDSSSNSQNKDDMLKKERGWGFLESLSSSPSIAPKILESSAWLELLGILVGYSEFTKVWIARIGAAKILSRLLWDPKIGQTLASLLGFFLPMSLIVVLKEEGPDTMLTLFDGESDTPELIWDNSMRGELRRVASLELDSCMQLRRETGRGNENFHLNPNSRVKFTRLENELFIGGVYVGRFLKEPTFNIRDPTSFIEALLLRWTHDLQMCTDNESNGEEKYSTEIIVGSEDKLQPVTDATVYLCKIRTNLSDKLAQWGYMARCLTFLENILAQGLLGYPLLSVVRILHVAANRRVNIESLIASGTNDTVHGIVAFTIRAVGDTNLHPDASFILEMLKKIFLDALGDVKKAAEIKKSSGMLQMASPIVGNNYAMAPSPAPGENPVSRNRIRVSAGDDPLGLGGGMTPAPAPMMSQHTVGYPNTAQNFNQTHLGMNQNQSQMASQIPYNQTNNSQHYNPGFQQPQPLYNNQMPYGNIQNAAGIQQTYHAQSQQTPHHLNATHQYRSHHLQQQQQQQSMAGSYSHQSTRVAQQTYATQQNSQQSGHVSYSQPNTMPGQETFIYQGMNQRTTNTHQQNKSMQPNSVLQGQGMLSRYGMGSQTSNNVTYQNQLDSGNFNVGQSWQGSSQNSSLPQGQQIAVSNPLPAPNPVSQMSAVQTSPLMTSMNNGPNAPPGGSAQVQNGQYHLSPAAKVQQQMRNSQSSASSTMNNTMQPQSNQNHPSGADVASRLFQQPNTQSQASERFNQPQSAESNAPIVETVTDVNPQAQYEEHLQHRSSLPTNEGSGIDARTQDLSPSVKAAQAAETVPGAPGCADGRRALLESALRCDLPKYLIESVLENPKLSKVKDPAAAKVHVVELLKLLTQDPGYGLKFQIILEQLPPWKKYVSQDHSLFITGHEQKADYFLTDGSSSMEAKKLLTEG